MEELNPVPQIQGLEKMSVKMQYQQRNDQQPMVFPIDYID
jgi:hypothetical protein